MGSYTKYHEIETDNNPHLDEIVASMIADGWVGLPLLADGEQLLNGAHRYTASQIAGIEPQVHQMEITLNWGDDEDYLLDAYAMATDTPSMLRALRDMFEAGYVDQYSVEIMSAEADKE